MPAQSLLPPSCLPHSVLEELREPLLVVARKINKASPPALNILKKVDDGPWGWPEGNNMNNLQMLQPQQLWGSTTYTPSQPPNWPP